MIAKVRETIEQFHMINEGEHVVVGVSGGADSVALLINLIKYRALVNFKITVVHINHMIRQDASDDADYVRELCNKYNVDFKLYEIDIPVMSKECHLSSEEAGRIARYNAMREQKPNKIAVGHHMDDLAETVMLNMCRGTGIHGMTGISPINDDIIRPLLYVSRNEIEEYLNCQGIRYCTDSTNLEEDYVRNRIRRRIFPYLIDNINSRSIYHIAEMANDMLDIEEYINKQTEIEFANVCEIFADEIVVNKEYFAALENIIKREILLVAFEKLTPHRKDISRKHVESIIQIAGASGEKYLYLPYGLEAISSYDKLILRKKRISDNRVVNVDVEFENGQFSYDLSEESYIEAKIYENSSEVTIEDITYTKILDYDKIRCSPKLRNRIQGDYLTVDDNGKKKSLKEYFINEKIPREERDKILLLADGQHIIWAIGYRISSEYKVTDKTKRILEISLKNKG